MIRKIVFLPVAAILASTGAAAAAHLRLLVWYVDGSPWSGAWRRQFMCRYVLGWCGRVFRVWSAASFLKLDLPTRDELDLRGKHLLVVANHRSEYDIPLVAEVLRRLGVDGARWVANGKLVEYPVLRKIFRETAIPVERNSGLSQDIEVIAEAARTAARELQSVVIFPEGTTYREEATSPDWHGVLRPKTRGFVALAENLPEHGVLVIAISYGGPVRESMRFGEDYLGRRVTVRARYHPTMPAEPAEWLEAEWRRVESELSEVESSGP